MQHSRLSVTYRLYPRLQPWLCSSFHFPLLPLLYLLISYLFTSKYSYKFLILEINLVQTYVGHQQAYSCCGFYLSHIRPYLIGQQGLMTHSKVDFVILTARPYTLIGIRVILKSHTRFFSLLQSCQYSLFSKIIIATSCATQSEHHKCINTHEHTAAKRRGPSHVTIVVMTPALVQSPLLPHLAANLPSVPFFPSWLPAQSPWTVAQGPLSSPRFRQKDINGRSDDSRACKTQTRRVDMHEHRKSVRELGMTSITHFL